MGYHAWFEPLSRRLLTLAIAFFWVALEAWNGAYDFWLWLAIGVTAWTVWELFLRGRYGGDRAAG